MTARKKTPPKKTLKPAKEPAPVVLNLTDQVRVAFDELRSAFAGGWSLEYAVAMHMPEGTNPLKVRSVIAHDKLMRVEWAAIREARAEHFFEKAAMQAEKLEREDPGKAGDLYLKLAAKQNPRAYGDKATVEISGPDGGPIESVTKLSPSEAYQLALKGGA